jgi:hypothetical protein
MMADPENTAQTRAHKATVIASEGVRQGNIQAATKTFNAGGAYSTLSAAVKAEELAHQRRILTSCLTNGIQPGVAIEALRELGTGGV